MRRILLRLIVLAFALTVALPASAQNAPGQGGATPVQLTTPYFSLIPISATAAVNTQTVLTIPAPSNAAFTNYVCYLAFELNSDATGAAVSNAVTTSANFNSFAIKVSFPATVSIDSGVQQVLQGVPGTGCAKSAVAGTATTFTSTASLTHVAFTWYATYYQAP